MTAKSGSGFLFAFSIAAIACSSSSPAGGAAGSAGTSGTGSGAAGAGAVAGATGLAGAGGEGGSLASGGATGLGGSGGTVGGAGAGGNAGAAGAGGKGSPVGAGGTLGVAGAGGMGGVAGAGGGAGASGMTCDGFRIPEDHPNVLRDYDTSTPDVVSDAVTGLMWERTVTGNDAYWNSARAYCAQRTLAGSSGWRLPTLLELESIVDFGVHDPAIAATPFPGTPSTWFITSTPVYSEGRIVGGPGYGWTTDFGNGSSMNGMPPFGYVRCVRTSAPPLCHPAGARFQPSPSAVASVLDATTMLTWQTTSSPTALDWADAKSTCASLGDGFRLPGLKELQSIVDWTASGVAIDVTAFPGTPREAFWSSAAVATTPGSAWTVDFAYAVGAQTQPAATTDLHYVRCVRSF